MPSKYWNTFQNKTSCSYLPNCLENLFFVRIHLDECADLREIYVFTVAQSDNFIKSEDQVKSILANFRFFIGPAVLRDLKDKQLWLMSSSRIVFNTYHFSEQSQSFQIF